MRKILSFVTIFLFSSPLFSQTNYYVGVNGNDIATAGTSSSSPFKTITFASTIATHGDTINVLAGTYRNDTYKNSYDIWKTEKTVRINNKVGTNGKYLVIRPYQNNAVKFVCDGDIIFQIRNSSYIQVEGFEIEGEVARISLDSAIANQFIYKDNSTGNTYFRVTPGTPASVVETMTFPILTNVQRPSYYTSQGLVITGSHHINIFNNNIHHCQGNGLRLESSDYCNAIGNIVNNCTRRSSIGNPAIVISNANSIDNFNGVKILISGNLVFDNYNEIYSWNSSKTFITPLIDEGKGISAEHCITRVGSTTDNWYAGRIRMENNICYNNGFSGVNLNEAERVDMVHNTCYNNFASGRGMNTGISSNDGVDVVIANNISVSLNSFGGYALSAANTTGLVVENNLVQGTIDDNIKAVHKISIVGDPKFTNPVFKDFSLQNNSLAINSAIPNYSNSYDYNDDARDNNPDMGAIEFYKGCDCGDITNNTNGGNTSSNTLDTANTFLYKVYENYFPIGCAFNAKADVSNTALKSFIPKHYNSITAENHLKPKFVQPSQNSFDWRYADSTVNFAKRNNMKIRGHTLAWYLSMPSWMYKNSNNTLVNKTELLNRMQTHINTTVGRYGTDIYCWDVVNEAIVNNDDTTIIYRATTDTLYMIAGEDYIEMAFRYAYAANNQVKLFYNDYRFSNPIKRKKIYKMLKRLIEKGVPIDGVGMQEHLIPDEMTEAYLQETIDMFAGLGLKIQITELDLSVYDYRTPGSPDLNIADSAYTSTREAKQNAFYEMLFRTYRRNKNNITGITFWGVRDSHDNFRTNDIGKMDYPFLFDEQYKNKSAFYKVVKW